MSAPTLAALRRSCAEAVVVAAAPDIGQRPHPPGVDVVRAVPPSGNPRFPAAVREVAVAAGVDVVLPWSDRDALAIAPAADIFASAGVAVVCPRSELVELACDKWATLRRLADLGVTMPNSRLAHSGEQLRAAAVTLGYPKTSLIVKPRGLSGGQGVWIVRADADPTRTAPRPQVPLAAMMALLDACPVNDAAGFVVQQEVHGSDVSVDLLARDGELLAAVARTREATLGGLSVQGTAGPLDASLASVIGRLVSGLGWSSLANVQLVLSEDGPVVYEINARASGSIGIAALGGLDLLWWAIRQARGEPLPRGGTLLAPLRFRRYWSDQWWPIEQPESVES
ncbi:MAG: ATP-grasp domain-containing protein [Sciscionella sp.]